ncbi:MAG TPA: S41 family peptidase [Phycisphaerae bacterium]|nr:S41 family peptidase [Phycisphaerae bacterium]
MYVRSRGLKRNWLFVALLAAWMAAPAASAVEDAKVASGSPQLWQETVRQVKVGDFADAAAKIGTLERLGPGGARVADWLRDWQQTEQRRREMTRADFDKYITWGKERLAKGQIEKALDCAGRAFENTADKKTFLTEPWLLELKEAALARAAELREQEDWLKAHAVYYDLSAMFEHDKELKRLRRECLTHARFEVMYKPDESEPTRRRWEEYLQGIEWRMVRSALYRIDRNYVSDVDFRELTVAGLEQLVLLARSGALQQVFDSLADEWDREQFIQRVEERIGQVRRMDSVSFSDAIKLFRRVMKINEETVNLPEALIVSEFMNGALETLDEFTAMIWPVEYREFNKHTRGDFIGVGISISRVNNEIVVVTPLEDSPAYHQGIMADDVIVKVDGQSTEGMSLTKAVETITGPIDTTVVLTVRRKVDGQDQEMVFPLKRKMVVIQSVKGFRRDPNDPQGWDFMIDPETGIGFIRVVAFQDNTVEHLRATIEELQAKAGLQGLILDLRFNPGGLLRSAVQMTELFLHKDEKIVSTKGDGTREYPIYAQQTGPFVDLPLVVLINGSSASASEIVSGALRDHHRATIIGERTFGKFSVQNLVQLDGSDAHLKLTTAAYYLPSGKSLHRTEDASEWGVEPDIAVDVVPKELFKILIKRRDTDVIARRDTSGTATDGADTAPGSAADVPSTPKVELGDTQVAPSDGDRPDADQADDEQPPDAEKDDDPLPADPNDRPEIDPQIEAALLVMRVQHLAGQNPQLAFQSPETAEARP